MSDIEYRVIEACLKSDGGPMTREEKELFDEWVAYRQALNPRWVFYLVLGIIAVGWTALGGVLAWALLR